MKHNRSLLALLLCYVVMTFFSQIYYPKWKQNWTEASIGWDVSGYYLYLPATFIYKDVKQLGFMGKVLQDYRPTPNLQQAFKHPSGNYVMKYSAGQAIMYAPFFFIAHGYASISKYPADGFSRPYQLAISIGSLLVAFLGLFYLRKTLRLYFKDGTVALVLIGIALGSNYLDYTAINGAMSHNYLFTLYVLLIWNSISFYKTPSIKKAVFIGLLIGLAALTRPTEILSALIPLLWGMNLFSSKSWQDHFQFFKTHFIKYIFAGIAVFAIGFIQLLYWKHVTSEWIVYSYEDQGFSWLSPHIYDGLFHVKAGWLLYSPIFLFALVGFIPLWKKHKHLFSAVFVFFFLFAYVVLAWDIWDYGGGLGHRAMIQSYAILAFPLAAFIEWVSNKWWKYIFLVLGIVFLSYNIWLTHHAHKGGLLKPGQMTDAYLWNIIGHNKVEADVYKLLDTDEIFKGERKDVKLILEQDFEQDSSAMLCPIEIINGNGSLCLNADRQKSQRYVQPFSNQDFEWVRAQASFRCQQKEWDVWRMAKMHLWILNGDEVIKTRSVRLYRFLWHGGTRDIYIDVSIPDTTFDSIGVSFTNEGSDKPLLIDDLQIEVFNEQ